MNHEEWLEARKSGIGGSDAAAILGLSPYKTNIQLWEEKTGRRQPKDISDKPYVQYGKKAESHLRGLFELEHPEYEMKYDEFGMIANRPDCPWLFATLDGEITYKSPTSLAVVHGVLEIKTTEIVRSSQWKVWNNRIPQNYYIQVLHQLLATGYDFAILMAQIKARDKEGQEYYVRRFYRFGCQSVQEDMQYLINKEKEFWECVTNDKRPALILPEV